MPGRYVRALPGQRRLPRGPLDSWPRHYQKIPKHFRAVTSTPASRLADNQVVLAKEISCCSLLGGREWSVPDVSKRGEVSEAGWEQVLSSLHGRPTAPLYPLFSP